MLRKRIKAILLSFALAIASIPFVTSSIVVKADTVGTYTYVDQVSHIHSYHADNCGGEYRFDATQPYAVGGNGGPSYRVDIGIYCAKCGAYIGSCYHGGAFDPPTNYGEVNWEGSPGVYNRMFNEQDFGCRATIASKGLDQWHHNVPADVTVTEEHNWVWIESESAAATCMSPQRNHFRCICGAEKDEWWGEPNPNNHNYQDWRTWGLTPDESNFRDYLKQYATCTEASQYWYSCVNCAKADVNGQWFSHGSALDHTYIWVHDDDATCTHNGTRHQYCNRINKNTGNVCGATTPQSDDPNDPMKGHTHIWIVDQNLTCTQDCKGHQYCTAPWHNDSKDGARDVNYTTLRSAPGHHFEQLVNDSQATCTTAGASHYVCTNTINGTRCTETNSTKGNFSSADHSTFGFMMMQLVQSSDGFDSPND